MDLTDIKSLLDQQGEAFAAFKATHEELKKADVVTAEKLSRIEATLDTAVEAKAKLEARIAAEAKEREELELRLSRKGIGSEEAAKLEAELKSFRLATGAETDADGLATYKAGHARYLRKGKEVLDRDEFKAMSVGGDPDGGYLVPPDTSGRIVRRIYETSPIRQIASVITIGTDKIEGIEDLGEAGSGWVGETTARTETTTPQVGRWSIEVFEQYAAPKTTQKILDDAAVDVEGWLGGKVGDRLGRRENAAFVSGDGMLKPRGFLSYTAAADSGSGVTWGQVGYVASGASGAFAASNPADKLFDLVGALKEAYLPNARFVTRRTVVTQIRKFKDGQGNYLWQPGLALGVPETILGYPLTRAEDMPAIAADSLSMAFGDFAQAYQIVDRTGIRVLRDPYTEKGFVIFYSTKRVGGGVVNFEAYKVMKFATS